MNVTIPDSLKQFVDRRVNSGRYTNADAFVADLVRTEAEIFEQVNRGESLPIDERFAPRLEALLDEAAGGEYVDVTTEDFDAMEREAQELARKRKS